MDAGVRSVSPAGLPVGRRTLLRAGLGLVAGPVAGAALIGCSPGSPPHFRADNGVIRGLDGEVFVPVGANIGTRKTFDWKGDSRGHAEAALEWGWNTVRLNVMVTDAAKWSFVEMYGVPALLDLVSEVVEEYTGAGLVVIVDAHDNPKIKSYHQHAMEQDMLAWWTAAATRFRDNPRVWSGLINEPDYANDDWLQLMDAMATAVRATGNPHPILIGAPCWGQDVGYTTPYFTTARYSYEPSMAPALSSRHGNLILEQHNYGAYGKYASADRLAGYLATVRGAGLTPLIGEFGYTIDGTSTAGEFTANRDGAEAVFEMYRQHQVGALWWHATHGDNYSLKANGGPFWDGGAGNGLSEAGRRFWALTH